MSTKVIHKGRGTIMSISKDGGSMHIHNGKDIVLPKGARVISTSSTNQKPHIMLKNTEYKHCSYCDTWYTLDEFWAHADHWDGLQHHCKDCVLEQNRLSLRRRRT